MANWGILSICIITIEMVERELESVCGKLKHTFAIASTSTISSPGHFVRVESWNGTLRQQNDIATTIGFSSSHASTHSTGEPLRKMQLYHAPIKLCRHTPSIHRSDVRHQWTIFWTLGEPWKKSPATNPSPNLYNLRPNATTRVPVWYVPCVRGERRAFG